MADLTILETHNVDVHDTDLAMESFDIITADEYELLNDDVTIKRAEVALESYNSIYNTVSLEAEDGGMNVSAAKWAGVAVAVVNTSIGVEGNDLVPAMESFSERQDHLHETNVALEGIKERIAKIWKTIVAKIREYVIKLKVFMNNSVSWASQLSKSSSNLIIKLEKSDKVVDNDNVTLNSSVYDKISNKGKFSDTDLVKGLSSISKANYKQGTDDISGYYEAYSTTLDKLALGSSSELDDSVKSVKGNSKLVQGAIKSKVIKTVGSVTTHLLNELPLGDSTAVFTARVKQTGDDDAIAAMEVNVIDDKRKHDKDEKVKALEIKNIVEILQAVKVVADSVVDTKNDYSKHAKLSDGLIKSADDKMKELGKLEVDGETDRKNVSYIESFIKQSATNNKLAFEPQLAMQNYNMATAKAAYKYATICVSNLKKA